MHAMAKFLVRNKGFITFMLCMVMFRSARSGHDEEVGMAHIILDDEEPEASPDRSRDPTAPPSPPVSRP